MTPYIFNIPYCLILLKLIWTPNATAFTGQRGLSPFQTENFKSKHMLRHRSQLPYILKATTEELQSEGKAEKQAKVAMEVPTEESESEGRLSEPAAAAQPTDAWNPLSRQLVGLLGSVGAAECAYITYTKFVQPEALIKSSLCQITGGGCGEVLTGPFSQLGGMPLTLPAMLIYGAVAFMAIWPLLIKNPEEKFKAEESTRPLILISGTGLATFSTYLMMVLAFRLHTACPYCLLSALCSYSIAAIAWGTRAVQEKLKATVLGVCTFLITAIGSGLVYFTTDAGILSVQQAQAASPSVIAAVEVEGPIAPPPITTTSSAQAIRLSERLKALDAKMYGAYWCSHCYDQKQAFGKEAYKNIKYIECSKKGLNSENNKCQIRDVPGYPTWEINGELYPGERSLDSLEQIVNEVMASK